MNEIFHLINQIDVQDVLLNSTTRTEAEKAESILKIKEIQAQILAFDRGHPGTLEEALKSNYLDSVYQEYND